MERQGSPLRQGLGESGNKADQAAAVVGEKLGAAADTLRSTLPQEGRLGGAARTITEGLESSGNYLQEQGRTGVIDDLESLIRRYPVQALLLGVGLGYILSRLRAR
jgi:hypothetical protein